MRNLVPFRAPDDLREGMLEDAEKFVGHFRLAPHEGLQTLHPFEIGNDHAAGVAKNVGNDENFVPALVQNAGRPPGVVGPFAPSARMRHFNLGGVLFRDHAIDRGRHEHVARHRRAVRSGQPDRPRSKARRFPFFMTCCSAAFDIDAFRIVKRDRGIADADDFYPGLQARATSAATEPTLPNPCTIAVHFSGSIFSMSIARSMR